MVTILSCGATSCSNSAERWKGTAVGPGSDTCARTEIFCAGLVIHMRQPCLGAQSQMLVAIYSKLKTRISKISLQY